MPRITLERRSIRNAVFGVVLLATAAMTACGPRPLQLPEPRSLIVSSGARLSPDAEQLRPVYEWVNAEIENIDLDPSFLIRTTPTSSDVYPWETLEIEGDTAAVQFRRSSPDVQQVYQIYAHLHLMAEMGRLDEWAPEAVEADGWDREFAFLARMTDAWLLGRSSFDFTPYAMLDEMIYADAEGMLEDFLLTIRGWEFPEARDAWLESEPDAEADVREWYRETFGKELEPRG